MTRAAPNAVRVRPGEILLFLSPVALVVLGLAGLPWLGVAAAALVEMALVYRGIVRRGGAHWVGPLFVYDLVRLARRGRTTLLRCLYAGLLLGVLYLVYAERFPDYDLFKNPFDPGLHVTLSAEAAFAREFITSILLLQGMAVLVLTPAYLAGAVAEEKEQGTLELLFTTHLHDREIVLGKLLGRLSHLAIVLLTGLPILMLVELFGGVDVVLVLAGFVASALSLLSIGSISIFCSVMARRVLTAMLTSYAACVGWSICCLCLPVGYVSSPVAFVMTLSQLLSPDGTGSGGPVWWWNPRGVGASSPVETAATMLLLYAGVHGSAAVFFSVLAVSGLRTNRLGEGAEPFPGRPPGRLVGGWDPSGPLTTQLVRSSAPARRTARPAQVHPAEPPPRTGHVAPIGDRPLLWKEMYHGLARDLVLLWGVIVPLWRLWLAAAVFAAVFLYAYLTSPGEAYVGVRDAVDVTFRGAFALLACCWCVCLAFRAASCISSERDRRTLDSLFTLPVERSEIFEAKWLGSILRYRVLACLLGVVWIAGVLTGSFHPLSALLLALACLVHVAFLASLGVWLSLVCRNTLWANMTMALALLLLFAGSWLFLAGVASGPTPPLDPLADWQNHFYEVGLNPVRSWWALAFSWDDLGDLRGPYDPQLVATVGAALAGTAVYAVLACALWLLAGYRFRREVSRGR